MHGSQSREVSSGSGAQSREGSGGESSGDEADLDRLEDRASFMDGW